MNKKCPNCNVINFISANVCVRCQMPLDDVEISLNQKVSSRKPQKSLGARIIRRAVICLIVCIITLFGFYLSLLATSKPLVYEEKKSVKRAIKVLEAKGFDKEVFLLQYLASFRGNDNWLNASTRDESAYASANFPFEILTVYPEFFTVPQDDTERAMILLHEAQHLKGADEKQAYEYVWRNRYALGWTREIYGMSKIYAGVEKQTRELSPELFRCDWNVGNDCTETPKLNIETPKLK